jgi:hypothetical protein
MKDAREQQIHEFFGVQNRWPKELTKLPPSDDDKLRHAVSLAFAGHAVQVQEQEYNTLASTPTSVAHVKLYSDAAFTAACGPCIVFHVDDNQSDWESQHTPMARRELAEHQINERRVRELARFLQQTLLSASTNVALGLASTRRPMKWMRSSSISEVGGQGRQCTVFMGSLCCCALLLLAVGDCACRRCYAR